MLDTYSRNEESFLVFLLYPIRKYSRLQLQQLNICIHIFTYTQSERKRTSKLRTNVVGFVSYLRITIFQHLQLCNFYDKLA